MFRVVSLVVSGFFFYMVSLLAFVNEGPQSTKYVIMGVFSLPALLFLGLGLDRRSARHIQRGIGYVFVGAAAVSGLVTYQVYAMAKSPETAKYFKSDPLKFFGDYVTGISFIILYILIGTTLLLLGRRGQQINPTGKQVGPPANVPSHNP